MYLPWIDLTWLVLGQSYKLTLISTQLTVKNIFWSACSQWLSWVLLNNQCSCHTTEYQIENFKHVRHTVIRETPFQSVTRRFYLWVPCTTGSFLPALAKIICTLNKCRATFATILGFGQLKRANSMMALFVVYFWSTVILKETLIIETYLDILQFN